MYINNVYNMIKEINTNSSTSYVKELLKAIENDNNANVLNMSYQKIKSNKNDVLQQIGIRDEQLKNMHDKLKVYYLINAPDELHPGCYIRWINIEKNDRKLTNGGHVHYIEYCKDKICRIGIKIRNGFLKLLFTNVVIFQKLTEQEELLLHISKVIDKSNI